MIERHLLKLKIFGKARKICLKQLETMLSHKTMTAFKLEICARVSENLAKTNLLKEMMSDNNDDRIKLRVFGRVSEGMAEGG